jgi:hypothetical protein
MTVLHEGNPNMRVLNDTMKRKESEEEKLKGRVRTMVPTHEKISFKIYIITTSKE